MKLTISRTQGQKGILKIRTVYYLNVAVENTIEEMALLEKYSWKSEAIAEYQEISFYWSRSMRLQHAEDFVGKRTSWECDTVAELEDLERKVIELMRVLNRAIGKLAILQACHIEHQQRDKRQAAGFKPEGPRDIKL